jgi:hypothetical protein
MNDAVLVCIIQSPERLPNPDERAFDVCGAARARYDLFERAAFQVLDDQKEMAVLFDEVHHLSYVRMAQLGLRARFLKKAVAEFLFASQCGSQHLDRSRCSQHHMASQENFSHAAFANPALDDPTAYLPA